MFNQETASADILYHILNWDHYRVTKNITIVLFALKFLIMFLPNVNFVLIFMLDLNVHFPWYLPITRSTGMIDWFLFASLKTIRGSSKVRKQSYYLYQKLMCSFSYPSPSHIHMFCTLPTYTLFINSSMLFQVK